MLKHEKGNVLDMAERGQFSVVLHGCNCFNTMGGGIAREIAQRYPTLQEADNTTKPGDIRKLGNWTSRVVASPLSEPMSTRLFSIYNCYTQYNMSNGEDVFEYDAFGIILRKLSVLHPREHYGLPYIGMGLARGNKEIIVQMIQAFADTVTPKGGSVTLVEFA